MCNNNGAGKCDGQAFCASNTKYDSSTMTCKCKSVAGIVLLDTITMLTAECTLIVNSLQNVARRILPIHVGSKNLSRQVLAELITASNIDRFSKFYQLNTAHSAENLQ